MVGKRGDEMKSIKYYLQRFKWRLIKLIAGNEPIIMNCTFNCNGLKEGWWISDPKNPDKSLITGKVTK